MRTTSSWSDRWRRGVATPLIGLVMVLAALAPSAMAGALDDIGITALRNADPTLTGNGIAVIQVEAGASAYQVDPATVHLSPSQFTYINYSGTTPVIVTSSTYTTPNAAGGTSSHANSVARNFYGNATSGVDLGAAPGVSTIDNYSADSYCEYVIAANNLPSSIDPRLHDARIVNQSFIFTEGQVDEYDQYFDWYAEVHDVLFVSAIGNGGSTIHPASLSTAYNGIGVAALGIAAPTIGPTTDGRSKPDITAPSNATSYSTPYVSGCAAVLMQAAARGDGGGGTENIAGHIQTVKALLLNGAVKPAGWSNTSTQPLDITYGAGQLNVFNSWRELSVGQQTVSAAGTVSRGADHMPDSASNDRLLRGWDYAELTSSPSKDAVNDYFITLPGQVGGSFWLTATLVWNRQAGESQINNLDLFLYNVTDQSLVDMSISTVDNVEHLYVGGLDPADTYALQVWKDGGSVVSNLENYALAYDILMSGDANGDGSVNGTDLNAVLSHYNQSGMDWVRGDFNRDGSVNGTDLNTVLSTYNQSYFSATAAVPEPGTAALLGGTILAICGWLIRRRR